MFRPKLLDTLKNYTRPQFSKDLMAGIIAVSYTHLKAWMNYAALQRGEETRFSAGESSLFLVNARENKTLEAFQKLQELKAKFFKAGIGIQWAAGTLTNR